MIRSSTLTSSVLIATLFLGAGLTLGAETKSPGADTKSAASKSKVGEDDAQFAREAASAGRMEVQLGKVAQERTSNARVKEFGSRMAKDHSKANDQLKKIASKKDIKLPTELDARHKATVNKLSKLRGDEFDREYMSAMVDDHKEDLEKFQRQADKGQDPDLKKFAQDHVPILKKHLELAEQTRKQAGSSKGK